MDVHISVCWHLDYHTSEFPKRMKHSNYYWTWSSYFLQYHTTAYVIIKAQTVTVMPINRKLHLHIHFLSGLIWTVLCIFLYPVEAYSLHLYKLGILNLNHCCWLYHISFRNIPDFSFVVAASFCDWINLFKTFPLGFSLIFLQDVSWKPKRNLDAASQNYIAVT